MDFVEFGKMQHMDSWEDTSTLQEFCASQLLKGRLSIVLGAGFSMGCKLPDWDTLIMNCCQILNVERSSFNSKDNEDIAEDLFVEYCNSDEIIFANAVRKALYLGYNLSPNELAKHELLTAIGALTMASNRGNAGCVVSFNFDDLLETYLRYFGFSMQPIVVLPQWRSRVDVRVYHPHGYLPSNKEHPIERGVILARNQYDRIIGKNVELWRGVLLDIFQSNTCLFIGLSGNDNNLTELLSKSNDYHCSKKNDNCFWGIRFSDNPDDPKRNTWEHRGVFQETLPSYLDMPAWLLKVCQTAAEMSC